MSESSVGKPVVFITGASTGIGARVAQDFGERGYRVALVARRKEKLEAVAAALASRGVEALALQGDVTAPESLDAAVKRTREAWGRIDVVVANAGFAVSGPMSRLTTADYRRQFETNVFGVLLTIYATRESLVESRGILALIGSVAGSIPMPLNTAYSMSKFAVRALALGLRGELARKGVSVVHVQPGFIESEIGHVGNDGLVSDVPVKEIPRRLVVPLAAAGPEIADAILSRKREVVITRHGRALVRMNHWFPRLYRAIARRMT